MAQPELEPGRVRLRVVHAVNSRLDRLSEAEVAALLAETRKTVREHFGIELEFLDAGRTDLHRLIAEIPKKALKARGRDIYDFKHGGGDRARLVAGMARSMARRKTVIADAIAYATPYLLGPVEPATYEGLAEALIDTHLKRLEHWRALRTASGEPVIDDSLANEWVAWDLLGYGPLPYDLIISNQLVASAEYDDAAINASLRGGVTAGTTSYNRGGLYNSYALISTFPFIQNHLLPQSMRRISSRAEAVRLLGKYTAHEIGHMLLLLGHPFGNKACVMRPEPLFDLTAWARGLDAAKCKLGSSRAMTPGVAKIFYRKDW